MPIQSGRCWAEVREGCMEAGEGGAGGDAAGVVGRAKGGGVAA